MSLLLAALGAQAATLTVGPGLDYTTIGAALEDAATGDRIEVVAGGYTERSLTVSHSIEIVGLGGSAATTWNGPANADLLRVQSPALLTLQGFTLRPGAAGAAVHVDQGDLVGTDLRVEAATVTAIPIDRGEVTLTDSVLTGSLTDQNGGHFSVEDGALTLVNCDLLEANGVSGGAIWATGSDVSLTDTRIEGNDADVAGGGLYINDGALTIVGGTFDANESDANFGGTRGGAIAIEGNTVFSITGTAFTANLADSTGGAVSLEDTVSGTFTDCQFTANVADFGGGIYTSTAGDVTFFASRFENNRAEAGNGGAIRARPETGNPTLTVTASAFLSNVASDAGGALALNPSAASPIGNLVLEGSIFTSNLALTGGAVSVSNVDALSGAHLLFCGNQSTIDGGAVRITTAGELGNAWTNSVFTGNIAGQAGGAMALLEAGQTNLFNNTFLANEALRGGGVHAVSAPTAFVNDLFAFTVLGNGIIAEGPPGTVTVDYSAFFDNTASDFPLVLGGAGNVFADPQLSSFSDDGNCNNDDVAPVAGSPLVDAGDPTVLDSDGTRSDIGATGGPLADAGDFVDADGDGFVGAVDCDDADPNVNPDASEVCNGKDDDCDGTVDLRAIDGTTFFIDADGDGFGGPETIEACEPVAGIVETGGDCNDTDATIYPGAIERCDGLDQDCDEEIDEGGANWWPDADADSYGDDSVDPSTACAPDGGIATNGTDCNDDDAAIFPGAEDPVGDGIDSNCDGQDGVYSDEDLRLLGNCGCASPAVPALPWLALALLGGCLGRRRRQIPIT